MSFYYSKAAIFERVLKFDTSSASVKNTIVFSKNKRTAANRSNLDGILVRV